MNIEAKLLEENDLLEKFHVEELEKRYEFKWVDQVKTGVDYEGFGGAVTWEV